uniref:Rhamnogalacturonan acetylesterase n=1 Tax=Roseihalotalea indica TaxID=2867963 RepID=A0AA49JKN6_9BACT|nr:rhamnogalacturonan acetylesterase [Tunicatimonas sp. TK19036]
MFLLLLSISLLSFIYLPKSAITVYLIGDSTLAKKAVKSYPETGWGMPFVYFFDSTVTVENHAVNGRSTKSFMEEDRWQPVVAELKEGDYVFIQFGHNDEVPSKVGRYTTPDEFKANLTQYVTETRDKQAKPVLITPVARRKFDEAGKIVGTHDQYSEIVRTVAREQQVPLIDLDRKSQALLQKLGVEPSKMLFNFLEPGEHPNYPDGREDNTHFSELGARKMAELVLAEIRALNLPLVERIVSHD